MVSTRSVALLFACISSLALEGCADKPVAAAGPPPPPNVEVFSIKPQNVPIYSDWVATLDGYVNATIQPQVSGYLVKQNYREGSFVHKGDVLFEIDARPFQALLAQAQGQVAQAKGQLAQAQAQLALAKINVTRDTPLAQAHAIAQSQLDNDTQAQAQIEALIETNKAAIQAAEAAVQATELNVGFTHVRSLVDGIAGIATTQIGNLVSTATVLTAVSQVDPIKVYFPISEQEYLRVADKIKPGAQGDLLRQTNPVPLELTLANGAVYPHSGRIIFTDRQVEQQTGTIRVVGMFANPGNILRPGQFGRVRALTAFNKDSLLVPQRAVTELQGRYQVAVVGPDNKVAVHVVEVGDRTGPNWIVKSGLNPGDRVISEGVGKVGDGSIVNPLPEKTPVPNK
ncbi:MAG TPA: efflux RND transporter periplasmic adaptor subunit [Bryobacteraceae bacterium]|nr:efflux RND transporter periplasmic adaptor subunit [Bryobacteraceae bacterium]